MPLPLMASPENQALFSRDVDSSHGVNAPQGGLGGTQREAKPSAADDFWWSISQLVRHRVFIIATAALVAVCAVVVTLLMPNVFEARTRLLLPAKGGLSDLLGGSLPSSARALLGGKVGDYTRALALLTSESMYNRAIDAFDLVEVYELQDRKHPVYEARKELQRNTSFEVDDEYEFLSIAVRDEQPERAAQIANFMATQLNDMNANLSSETARGFRQYVEARYLAAQAALDSTLDATRDFQNEYGVFALAEQTQGFFTQLAELRGEMLQLEIQFESAQSQLGESNAQVQQLGALVSAARRRYEQALQGSEQMLPVAQKSMPQVVRQYADLERERLMQATILETIVPVLEQARLEEMRRVETVQVIDVASPPERKIAPRRSVIVIVATLTAGVLACVFVLALVWWRRSRGALRHRLQHAEQASLRD